MVPPEGDIMMSKLPKKPPCAPPPPPSLFNRRTLVGDVEAAHRHRELLRWAQSPALGGADGQGGRGCGWVGGRTTTDPLPPRNSLPTKKYNVPARPVAEKPTHLNSVNFQGSEFRTRPKGWVWLCLGRGWVCFGNARSKLGTPPSRKNGARI